MKPVCQWPKVLNSSFRRLCIENEMEMKKMIPTYPTYL